MSRPHRFAVVGNPIAHSLSPEVHALFAQQTGIELLYRKLLAPRSGFASTVSEFFASGGQGVNVTAPFKGEAADWVDELDDSASATRSVNTISHLSAGSDGLKTRGYSTDGPGLVAAILAQWGVPLEGKRILVLGAGGASRAIIPSLLAKQPSGIVIANRTLSRAQALVEGYAQNLSIELAAQSLDDDLDGFDFVINAASMLFESNDPPRIAGMRESLCYDLSYNRDSSTAFCSTAIESGARDAIDGLGMLVWQGALSFQIWNGVLPETAPVLQALRKK